jgi:hypothetical protein
MRKGYKYFGIIIFTAIIGLLMTTCDEEDSPPYTLKVINYYNSPITRVRLGFLDSERESPFDRNGLNITSSESFEIISYDPSTSSGGSYYNWTIILFADGLKGGYTSKGGFDFKVPGETTTVILQANGTIY